MSTQDEWLTQSQVAKMLGVTGETLRRWRANGTGPAARRFGPRLVRYAPSEVQQWIASSSEVGSTAYRHKDPTLDARMDAWVQKQLEAAPPLTTEAQELLRRLLTVPGENPETGAA